MKDPHLILALYYIAFFFMRGRVCANTDGHCSVDTCEVGEDIHEYQWETPGVFDDLSEREIKDVIEYMMKHEEFNLHLPEEASVSDAYIFLVERLQPLKSEALAYLDDEADMPRREARVILHRGDLPTPIVEEYRVGPLPSPTEHTPLKNPKWRDPIPFHARSVLTLPQLTSLEKLLNTEMAKVDYILEYMSDGYKMGNCTNKCLGYLPSIPPYLTTDNRQMWVYLHRNIDGGYLYPVGMQARFNMKSADPSEWKIMQLWVQGTLFDSLDELINQYDSGTFKLRVAKEPEYANDKKLPGSMHFRGDPRPEKPMMGPRSYSPDGRRYKVNGHHVEWLGWSFDFNLRTTSGLQVHDVRFLNERIAYEISLQEITVFYSGGSPVPRHTNYFDSFTLNGAHNSELFRGVDCPYDATFFDLVHFLHGTPHLFKNVVCVFELDKGIPLRRHYDYDQMGGYHWFQGMSDIVLVMRTIATVYNYDYIIDLQLHQGGQIEMKTSLTGYTLNTFYTGPEMDKYGFQTQPDSIANIHHHSIHFKVDLDILGTDNRLHSLDIKLEELDDETNPGNKTYNRKFEKNLKNTEMQAAYKFNFTTPKYLVMFNNNKETKLGQKRGYRIAPVDMSYMLLPDDYFGHKTWGWTKYQVATTKRHDDEDRSSSIYATADPFDPVVDFEAFINDNENIVDQDLVSWISLGAHHIPHTEDVPVVLTPGVQLTFYLLPYNYFEDDISLASRDNIRVVPNSDAVGGMDYQYSGVKGTSCCNPRSIDGKGTEIPVIYNKAHSSSPALFTILTVLCITMKYLQS